MIEIVEAPKGRKIGRIRLQYTARVSEVESQIQSLGFKPITDEELTEDHADGTKHIIVAIGSKVDHPERKPDKILSYKGFQKYRGKMVAIHMIAGDTLPPNTEIAIRCA